MNQPKPVNDVRYGNESTPLSLPASPPDAGTDGGSRVPDPLAPPDCEPLELALASSIYASGLNGALTRPPQIEASALPMMSDVALAPPWKPFRSTLRCFGMMFPDALEFLLPKEERPTKQKSRQTQQNQQTTGSAGGGSSSHKKKMTRLQPPDDALSLEDRLFYVLQPPLESWLSGQELLMPFEPFPYQYEGIAWLFSQQSALLADEMGLGKTMQAITAIRLLLRGGQVRSVLLVCPKPLIPNWQREFKMWAEEIPVMTIEGDANRRKMIWTMPGIPVRIANYELMARDMEALGEEDCPKFDLLVLDEAQRIKNRDSMTARTARMLTRKRSWALTGTPIENRPEELASLYEFMEVIPPRGTPDLRQLKRLSERFILRRTKDLVMKDLPPRLDRDEYVELTPAQQYAYKVAETEGVIQLDDLGESITIQHVFELVLRLKQITNFDPLTGDSAKLDRLSADMEEIASSGGKAILFSQWTKCIDWLSERLKQFGVLTYHGGVPTKQREPILKRFEEDPDSHLLLMSYGTGAVGLNLQFAGYVFLFDRWWNPAVEDQAINRAHRIGQKSPVIVTKFISKDTIEERIDLVLRQKRELFEAVLGGGDATDASLSMNASEIFGLFDLKAKTGQGTRAIAPERPDEAHDAAA